MGWRTIVVTEATGEDRLGLANEYLFSPLCMVPESTNYTVL